MSYLDSSVFSSQNLPFSSSFITAAFEGRTIHLQKILLKRQMAAWIIRQFDYDDKFGKLEGYWAHKQLDMFEGNGESEELNGDDTNEGACLRQHGKSKEKADEQTTEKKGYRIDWIVTKHICYLQPSHPEKVPQPRPLLSAARVSLWPPEGWRN